MTASSPIGVHHTAEQRDWPKKRSCACVSLLGLCLSSAAVIPVGARGDFTDTIPARPDADVQSALPADDGAKPSTAETPMPSESTKKDLDPAPALGQKESSDGTDREKTASPQSSDSGNAKKDTSSAGGGLFSDDVTQHDQDAPVRVEGDLVTGAREKGELHLKGHVIIRQANAELRSEEATVYSEPGTTRAERAIAKGNVRFFKKPDGDVPPLKAEADELEYFVADRRIRLQGDPRVWRGTELIEGREIFVELDTGAVTIKGARGVIQPKPVEKSN